MATCDKCETASPGRRHKTGLCPKCRGEGAKTAKKGVK